MPASLTAATVEIPADAGPRPALHYWLRLDAAGRISWTSPPFAERFGDWLEQAPDGTLSALLVVAGVRDGGRQRWAHALAHGLTCAGLDLNPRADPAGPAAADGDPHGTATAALALDVEPERDQGGRLLGFLVQVRVVPPARRAEPRTAQPDWLVRWYEAARHDDSVGHFVRPLDGSPGFWDEGMFRLLGMPPSARTPTYDEVIERIAPTSRAVLLDAGTRRREPGRPYQAHYEIQHQDGTTRWVQSNWVIVPDADGRLSAFGSLRDVSSLVRQRYEAQLQREQLLLAADAAHIGLIREEFATGLCTTNRTARELYGLPDDDAPVLSRVLIECIHRDDIGAVRLARAAARSGAVDAGGEVRYRVRQSDGSLVHIRARRRVIFDGVGEPAEMVAVLIDDTAQVQAAERERALAERHAMALDIGGLGQWHWPGKSPSHYEFDRRQSEIYGLDPDATQMSLRDWAAAVHPADREAARVRWEQVGRTEMTRGRASFRIVRPDGEVRWVQISYAVQGRPGQAPVHVHGTTQDVTERERLLAALREERLALQRSQALAGVGSAWRHLETGAGAWSPQMFQLNRRDPALPSPTPAEAAAHLDEDTRERMLVAVREAQRTGQPYELEFRIRRDDGSQAWIRQWGIVESDESGRRVMHRYCAQDITDKHALQHSTEAARDRLQALFDNALNAIVVLDDDGRLADVNPAACQLFGHAREALLGRRIVEFGEAVGAESLRQQWRPFLASGSARGQMRLHAGGPGERFADYVATAHVQPGTHLCMLMDVTARVRAEHRLAQLAARQREDFEALQAEVARDVHDQLGQVLSALAYETDAVAARDPALAGLRGLVQRAVDTARDISRALRPPALDLGLPQALRSLAREVELAGEVDVEVDLPTDLPEFDDATRRAVYRIAQEAFSNVLRHAEARHAWISVVSGPLALEVCVEDDGRGVDTEALATTPGLGVVGMTERARALGGRLELERRAAGGTRVRLRLPRHTATVME